MRSSHVLLAILLVRVGLVGASSDEVTRADIAKQLQLFRALPSEVSRSPADTATAVTIVEHLNAANHPIVTGTIFDAISAATAERDLVRYRELLPKIRPSLKDDAIARLRAESSPIAKANLLVCLERFDGHDLVRALVEQFADRRPGESYGERRPQVLRVCDYSYNALYAIAQRDATLKVALGRPVNHDTSPDVRDERIDAAKSFLTRLVNAQR